MTALVAMVRKDLLVFFSDRRSVLMSFAVPIAIASFFGSIFSGPTTRNEPVRTSVIVADADASTISGGIVHSAEQDPSLRVATATEAEARAAVRAGRVPVAVLIPRGFGDAAGTAFFGAADKPTLGFLFDPSRSTELAMVRGVFTQHVMTAVSAQVFGGQDGRRLVDQALTNLESSGMPDDDRQHLGKMLRSVQDFYTRAPQSAGGAAARGITIPYVVREEPVTSGTGVAYNGYAHSFAGMGIQFLLFAAANLGVEVLVERQRGLWKRLRSAPVSRTTLLASKVVSGTIIALVTLLVSFGFAMIVFHVRIAGSPIGFAAVALACSVMAAAFGLLVAALGRTPGTARGVTTLAVLMMVMLGGAWVPSFIFPAWLQQITLIVPARWAVDGLDAMTWRGLGLGSALLPAAVLFGFAAVFSVIAFARFPWEES